LLAAGVLAVVALATCLVLLTMPDIPQDQAAPSVLLSIQLHLPDGATLAPGSELRGTIGGYSFQGHIGAPAANGSPRLRIASSTTSLAQQSSAGAPQTESLTDVDPDVNSPLTFTTNSDRFYPPGTVVSGWVNGKYFRGVVQGAGESESSQFNRRVMNLRNRVGAEEWRRGIRKQNDDRINKVISRIKALEKKMTDAYMKSQQRKRPTLIRGNVAGFHFHGSLEPASVAAAAPAMQQPYDSSSMLSEAPAAAPLSNEMSAQAALLAKVEGLEKEVKQAQ